MIKFSIAFESPHINLGRSIDNQVGGLCKRVQSNTKRVQHLVSTYTSKSEPMKLAEKSVRLLRTIIITGLETAQQSIPSATKAVGDFIQPPMRHVVDNISNCINQIPIIQLNVTLSNLDKCLKNSSKEVTALFSNFFSDVNKLVDSFCNSWEKVAPSDTVGDLLQKTSSISNDRRQEIITNSQQTFQTLIHLIYAATYTNSCIYSGSVATLINQLTSSYRSFLSCLNY